MDKHYLAERMEKFDKLISSVVPLAGENIDTDQIIPARFLKATTREEFGENLFREWRYDDKGEKVKDFPLNNKKYTGKILLAGKNFGCGSSREHAAWAIFDYGFRVVVSSYFADIFKNNALNNGLLPVQVSETFSETLFRSIEDKPGMEVEVDLKAQLIKLPGMSISEPFEINPFKKHCLLTGKDDFEFLLDHLESIREFEKNSIYTLETY